MVDTNIVDNLTEWAKDRHILPETFECPKYSECQDSRKSRKFQLLDRGNTCMMSYVGSEYGGTVSGKSFRLAIVGLDHGDTDGGDFDARQSGIEDWYYVRREAFNPHYQGVIRTAAVIVGRAGEHCLKKCQKRCAGDTKVKGEKCVLRMFAQPNLVKCVAAANRACKATGVMYRNCSRHLIHEFDVLKPDVVVFHGAPARWAFPLAAQDEGRKISPVLPGPFDTVDESEFPVLQRLSGGAFDCLLLFLAHPSRGHLARQWNKVVEPALTFLRAQGSIPS